MQSLSYGQRSLAAAAMLAVCSFVVSCSDPGTGSTDDGAISLSVSPASGTVQQGNSLQITGTVTRSGGFTGGISFVVSGNGLPAGLTGTATNLVTNGTVTTATITVATAATVPAGIYQITVTGSGSGVTAASATFSLTVTAIPPGTYALSVNPGLVSVVQGAIGSTTLSINRSNFTAPVTLTVEGLPNGVTASFSPVGPLAGNSTTLTLTASGAAAPGASTLTIRGSTAGQLADRTISLPLTVTVAGDYTLSAAPPSLSVLPGAGGSSTININRSGGFSGSMALAVSGAPANMTASVSPTPAGGNAATLTIGTTAGVTPGAYPLTITGTFAGLANHTATVTVTVINTTVRVDFSACAVNQRPAWFAGINGSTATRVTGVANVYTFQVPELQGGYAYVLNAGVGMASATEVQYRTRDELTANTILMCGGAAATLRTVNATVTGFGGAAGAQVNVSHGSSWEFGDYLVGTSFVSRTATAGTPTVALSSGTTGPSDLVAWRTTSGGPTASDRGLFLRAINPANNSSAGTLDMEGVNSFAAGSATATITGLLGGGDQQSLSTDYFTGAECSASRLSRLTTVTGIEAIFGVPSARQLASDFHSLSVSTFKSGPPNRARLVTTWFHTLANKTIDVPANFAGTVSLIAGQPYKAPLAAGAIPAGYLGGGARLNFSGSTPYIGFTTYNIVASAAWVGTSPLSLGLPDFTGQGFLTSWGVGFSDPASYQLNIYNEANPGARKCQEGFTYTVASMLGTL